MYLGKARSAIDSAATLVEDMVLEHGMLQGKKEAPQEESAEHKNDYVAERISRIKEEFKKSGIPCAVVIDNGSDFNVVE